MHIADPAQLEAPLESVASFRCDPEQLAASLHAVYVDPLSAPGPARLGAIQLANGVTIGVVVHDHGSFGEILTQLSADIERTLLESFRALQITASDIQWLREGIDASAIISALEAESPDASPVRPARVELAHRR